jgi:lysophospholipase L1-like esterase
VIPGITASGYGVSIPPADVLFPYISGENDVYNHEGDNTTGWSVTAGSGSLSASSSKLRLTKTSGTSVIAESAVSSPIASSRDWITYVTLRSNYATNAVTYLWLLGDSSGTSVIPAGISIGVNNSEASNLLGNVVLRGQDSGGSFSRSNIRSSFNYETNEMNLALQYDSKYGRLVCWNRESDGRWKFAGRLLCRTNAIQRIALAIGSASPNGTWIEFDYVTVCKPNLMVLGDSIAEGKTLFSPDPSLTLTNDESTWMRHAGIYPGLRNNLVVNRGVGSNTSAQMLARVAADIVNQAPKAVFLHASTNDYVNSISLATRTTNIQGTVDAIVTGGAQAVLFNALYGTSSASYNPGHRDYMKDWWDNYLGTVTDHYSSLDIMTPILDSGYMDDSLTQSDDIHPNVNGHTEIGEYIAAQPYGS